MIRRGLLLLLLALFSTLCAVLVLEDAVVVKTVMHHFEVQHARATFS
ncbi:MAG: hypothetical protein Q8L93_03835 [Rhodocyclaceae bacterium]|nr:hypothetical protein [Rhodocyclaceae bacterium]MDP1957381.1 hypothetical protein [Rhodocyclaceae bacterium]